MIDERRLRLMMLTVRVLQCIDDNQSKRGVEGERIPAKRTKDSMNVRDARSGMACDEEKMICSDSRE